MIVYNPEFFDNVSPKFLKQIDAELRECFEDGVELRYIHMYDYGAGKVPSVISLSEKHRNLAYLSRKLRAWQSVIPSNITNPVVVGKHYAGDKPIFYNL